MAKHFDWVTDKFGNAVAASVTVYLAGTSTLATLYSDAALTAALANPVTADSVGYFAFHVAPGFYKLKFEHSTFVTKEVDNVAIGAPALDVRAFGAKGDGVTDDTAAIASAIAAAEAAGAGTVYFPAGTYKVAGSGSTIFTITKPLQITGDGYSSQILVATGVPNTRDVFTYAPATQSDATFPLFRAFRIVGQSAGVGRYGINFKPSVTSTFVRRFGVERVWTENLSSFGVYVDGSVAGALSVFTSWIRDCQFNGNGFGGVDVKDSIHVENCVLAGTGYAVDVDFSTGGPGKFVLRDCNVTATNGVRVGGPVTGLALLNNYFEVLATYGGANNAFVDLNGSSGQTIEDARIAGNLFTILSGFGDPDALRINFCNDALITGNSFNVVPAGADAITITSNAKRTHVAADNAFAPGGGRWTNAGEMSSGGAKVLACLLADSTAIANTTDQTAHSKSFTFPANYFTPGQVLRIRAAGRFSCTGTPVLTNRIMLNLATLGPPISGGSEVAAEGFACASGGTNLGWRLEGYLVFRSVGATGSVARSHQASNTIAMSTLTVDTTAAITIHITSHWGTANAANTVVLGQLIIELLDSVAAI